MQGTSAFPWGNDVLRDFQFGCTGGSRADASGSHCTGRKEKPHQDNGKKPKCAKFYRNHDDGGNLTVTSFISTNRNSRWNALSSTRWKSSAAKVPVTA